MTISDELEKLAQLRNSGVLSQAEFDQQKARLLAGGTPVSGGMPMGGMPMGYGAPGQMLPKPPNYIVQAVLVALFCCLPFGAVAVVKSNQVDSAYAAGDYQTALARSKEAQTWVNLGVLASLLLGVGWFMLNLIGVRF